MINIGIFKTIEPELSAEAREAHQDDVDEMALQCTDYWNAYGLDARARGFLLEYDGYTGPPTRTTFGRFEYAAAPAVYELIDAGALGDYLPGAFNIWGGSNSRYCGLAGVGTNWSTTFKHYGCMTLKVMLHELFHAVDTWALRHAGMEKVDGTETEYGDNSDIVGGSLMAGLNAPHLHQLGIGRHLVTYASGEVLLAPVEVDPLNLLENEFNSVTIGEFCFSLRKACGFEFAMPSTRASRLYIHEVKTPDPGTRNGKTKRHKSIEPGHSFQVPDGPEVHYVDYQDEQATLLIGVRT